MTVSARTLAGAAVAGFGLTMFVEGVYHLVKTGTCASGTTAYQISRHCPYGTGWWVAALLGGIALSGVGLALGFAATRSAPAQHVPLSCIGAAVGIGLSLVIASGVRHHGSHHRTVTVSGGNAETGDTASSGRNVYSHLGPADPRSLYRPANFASAAATAQAEAPRARLLQVRLTAGEAQFELRHGVRETDAIIRVGNAPIVERSSSPVQPGRAMRLAALDPGAPDRILVGLKRAYRFPARRLNYMVLDASPFVGARHWLVYPRASGGHWEADTHGRRIRHIG